MSAEPPPLAPESVEAVARQLARRLGETRTRLVLAESCTGGLAAATLTTVPGFSQWFCGSAVTYRDATKIQWLDVSAPHLECFSAVSEIVAGEMARGVLARTPEADLALSITGHLGPDAPAALDGVVYLGVARRRAGAIVDPHTLAIVLCSTVRGARQREAATWLLHAATHECRV